MNKENEEKTLNGASRLLAATIYVCIAALLLAFTAKIVLWLLF